MGIPISWSLLVHRKVPCPENHWEEESHLQQNIEHSAGQQQFPTQDRGLLCPLIQQRIAPRNTQRPPGQWQYPKGHPQIIHMPFPMAPRMCVVVTWHRNAIDGSKTYQEEAEDGGASDLDNFLVKHCVGVALHIFRGLSGGLNR